MSSSSKKDDDLMRHGSSSANAVICNQHGDFNHALTLENQPIPVPKAGEVLVKMIAAAINPSDTLYIKGNYKAGPPLPARVGFEGVGTVTAVGPGISRLWTSFLIGKRVAVASPHGGTWAEYCVVPAITAIPIPREISNERAAGYFINPATALMLARWDFRMPLGNWMIQSAGASALARMLIRLGKVDKFRTISLIRKSSQVAELKALGADEVLVVDEHTSLEEFKELIGRITLAAPPKFAVDPVGGRIGNLMLNTLGQNGKMRVIAGLSGEPLIVNPMHFLINRLKLTSFWLDEGLQSLSKTQQVQFIRQLHQLHRRRVFDVETYQSFPLSDYRNALQATKTAPAGTKILLKMP